MYRGGVSERGNERGEVWEYGGRCVGGGWMDGKRDRRGEAEVFEQVREMESMNQIYVTPCYRVDTLLTSHPATLLMSTGAGGSCCYG